MTARLLADSGSTLEGVSWPVLGVILTVLLVVVLAYDYWRREHERRRRRRRERDGLNGRDGRP